MSYTVIIPSRNINNLRACIGQLHTKYEHGRVIIVWDGNLTDDEKYALLRLVRPQDILEVAKPFCFARNVNLGIEEAEKDGPHDVVLLNDDALLLTNLGLKILYNIGGQNRIVSPVIQGPAHLCHMAGRARQTVLWVVDWVPFVCVYIPRRCIGVVGLLDERFVPGGYEDEDYCRRAVQAAFPVCVTSEVVVDHQALPHTFRTANGKNTYDLALQRARFEEKWG